VIAEPLTAPAVATAAQELVEALVRGGVDRAFCVAGESYLAVLDALVDAPVDVVTCRHEASAAFMALADAKLTGRPALCLVNRAPGATNAAIGLHAARQDATPLLLLVGQVETNELGRDAFQELDYARTFSDLAKSVSVLHTPERAAETAGRALASAAARTPGAAVLVVPEDVAGRAVAPPERRPVEPRPAHVGEPGADELRAVAALLGRAGRPLLLAGSALSWPEGRRLLREAAERHAFPVVLSNKRQDLFDNLHPHYAGHLTVATRPERTELLAQADLVLAIGTRLDHVTTQRHAFPDAPTPTQPLVHVYPDPARVGFTYEADVALACDPVAFLEALVRLPAAPGRRAWVTQLHAAEREEATWREHSADDGVVFGAVVSALDRVAAEDVIVTIDAGHFTSWVHRYFRCTGGRRLLGLAPGPMGFGVPAGVAASLRHPGRQVVTVVGDGGMLMTGGELATAVQRGARLTVVIANNSSYGSIRHHQERAFPGRPIATDLVNPDFAELARAYGALGLTVEADEEIEPALERALAHDGIAVVDVRTSLSWISAYDRLPGARRPA
jgi:acetolactate synthase-1/2/3 large subunit